MERFVGSQGLLDSLENVDVKRWKPKPDHAMEYSWHQPHEGLRARRGKAEHRREELLHLLYRENISPSQAEELVKEWIVLVVERDKLLKEQMDKENKSDKVEYVRMLRQMLRERPALGECSEEVTLRDALLSLERHVIDYCRNTNISSSTPYKARSYHGRYASTRGRTWANRFNDSYDASHSFSDSSTPRYYSDDSETVSRFETASLTVPERMVYKPNPEPAKPVTVPPPSPTTSQSTLNDSTSKPVIAVTQHTSLGPKSSKDETDGFLTEQGVVVVGSEAPATSVPAVTTSPSTPPPPPPFLLPLTGSNKTRAGGSSIPSPLAANSRRKRVVSGVMGTVQFTSSVAAQANSSVVGKRYGERSEQSAVAQSSSSSISHTQPKAKDPSLLDFTQEDRRSLFDEISSIGQQHLRKTNKARSPGGTPIKLSKNRLTLTNNSDMLQRALISKFRSMHSTPIKGPPTPLHTSANEHSSSFDLSSAWSDINNSVAYADPDITATSSSGLTSGLPQPADHNNLSSAV